MYEVVHTFLKAFQRMIKQTVEKPAVASKLKRDHYAQIGVMEVFLEATPSAVLFIILSIFSITINDEDGLVEAIQGVFEVGNKELDDLRRNDLRALIVGSTRAEIALFFLSWGTSIFSSVFGVAR